MLEWEGVSRRFDIAAETIKGYEHHIRIFSPEIFERGAEGVDVPGINLFPRLCLFRFGSCSREIYKIKLEHPNSALVPILQDIYKTGQKSAFIERHRPPLPVHRVLPLRSGIDFHESIRAEPEARKEAVILTTFQPLIWTVWPSGFSPRLVAAVLGKPERVHHVVIEPDAKTAQPNDLIEFLHCEMFGQLYVIGKLVVGGPIVVHENRIWNEGLSEQSRRPGWRSCRAEIVFMTAAVSLQYGDATHRTH